jgi:hypothetical protein
MESNTMADLGPEDDFTDSEDLLNSITYGIRKFYLAGSWNDIIIGVMLEESVDSFLVALPAKITINDRMSVLEEVMETAYVRFLKSDFRAVTFASGMHRKMYIEYLMLKSPSVFPELLDMIGERALTDQAQGEPPSQSEQEMQEDMHNLSMMDVTELPGQNNQEETLEITPPAEGILVKGNMSDAELKITVERALEEGRFLPPQGKLPN